MNSIFQLLNPDNTISINRSLAHAIGLDEAVVYGAIISKWYYYTQRGMTDEEGWFYSTVPDMKESTAIGEKAQKRCIDNLVRYGLIKCELRGMPARRCFYVIDDPDIIEHIISTGEDIMEEIKPVAAEKNRRKVRQRDEKKNIDLPCSAEMEEQAPPECTDKFRQNGGTGSSQMEDKTKYNKSKDKNLNMIVSSIVPAALTNTNNEDVENQIRASINYQLVSTVSGTSFADNVVNAVYELLITQKSQTFGDESVPPQDIHSIISHINSDVVMQVSDTIYLKKGKIRDMKSYLKTALFLQTREYLDLPENSFGYEGHGAMREFRNFIGRK